MPAPTVDHAITLYRAQRLGEAQAEARAVVEADPADVTAWNLLGFLERDLGDIRAAAAAFDCALALRPEDTTALKGRARVALERHEPDTCTRYLAARAAAPDDPHVVLEQAEALVADGATGALSDLAELARRLPRWAEGQVGLARLLWEGERRADFADHIRMLLDQNPGDADLWRGLIALLHDCRHYAQAAAAARAASEQLPGQDWALLEAINAGHAGDLDRAQSLFAGLPALFPGRATAEAVHYIRRGMAHSAAAAVEAALNAGPSDVSLWAVAELVWRWTGDTRSHWLSGQAGLVRETDLPLAPDRFRAVHALLLKLHQSGSELAGQSVRAGKQTRGRLFDRVEPEFAELRDAVKEQIADYVAGLPPADSRHPLLRYRHEPFAIGGSWSVRFVGGGYHVSHIHPLGLLSSACYFEVPETAATEGQLLLGAPPSDFGLELEPLRVVTPCPGKMVLFPSYLHHGTRPFHSGTRLSVAFDVVRQPGTRG